MKSGFSYGNCHECGDNHAIHPLERGIEYIFCRKCIEQYGEKELRKREKVREIRG